MDATQSLPISGYTGATQAFPISDNMDATQYLPNSGYIGATQSAIIMAIWTPLCL
jgi:hypothetical protein